MRRRLGVVIARVVFCACLTKSALAFAAIPIAAENACRIDILAVSDDRSNYLYEINSPTHAVWDAVCVGAHPPRCTTCSLDECLQCEGRAIHDARLPSTLCSQQFGRLSRDLEEKGFTGVSIRPDACGTDGPLVSISQEQSDLVAQSSWQFPVWYSILPILGCLVLTLRTSHKGWQRVALFAMPCIAVATIAARVQADRLRAEVALPVVNRPLRSPGGVHLQPFPKELPPATVVADAWYHFPLKEVRFELLGEPRVETYGIEAQGVLRNVSDHPVELRLPAGDGEPFVLRLSGAERDSSSLATVPTAAEVRSVVLPPKTGYLVKRQLPLVGRRYRAGERLEGRLVFHYVNDDTQRAIGTLGESWRAVFPQP